ncbi:methyltransferase [Amycolatopsis mediterranei S699]|uniref:Methyltransferase n=3 Tax=Amycolatopsis mediterranei TaxID=33910 RepID=A0A0H3D2W6_AMYMU|nr:class I SAM-dependent methyltransferase [Amycolatopsis mediterranei]ADJ43846.1 methyltransferase [Amycolatopsis mediterranei U32]AEK40560.1 methyltransferase [Amycolatopsis mediterranei S699]AFO75560.1 methyltransferase [Amycolatopsis mediterranei S699]AGT82689.1 methyltransferase [Amycolatopsis mediterranei RB]KDO09148.1 ubiquinone biosynthesis methyltransferase UbiE [Amycolatopsis mediterranei]
MTDDALEASSVVANRAMNRERRLAGRDGYSRVLGFDILSLPSGARWLDLCCGSGRALLDAAEARPDLDVTGVDLVGYFAAAGPVRFETASITAWQPAGRFDLVTCVHGLHYVGDKLGALRRAASWLGDGGVFVANFDVAGIEAPGGARRVLRALREAGFTYDSRAHRIRRDGPFAGSLPFRYLGADDRAGPNYTGRPAVRSCYGSAL